MQVLDRGANTNAISFHIAEHTNTQYTHHSTPHTQRSMQVRDTGANTNTINSHRTQYKARKHPTHTTINTRNTPHTICGC